MTVKVQIEPFDVAKELEIFSEGNHAIGGLCNFIGLVRDINNGEDITSLTLEHYPGMTEKMLERIVEDAKQRWPLENALVIHRYGKMDPGEAIVMVATASQHREAAFESCHFIMDYLKTNAPFWKVEETPEGNNSWVDARDSDDTALKKWQS